MNINWYPGHMKKTADSIRENLKKVDVVLELIDARAPKSSKNPMIEDLKGEKPTILIMTKEDLADKKETNKWKSYYRSNDYEVVSLNASTGEGIKSLFNAIDRVMASKREKNRERGIESELVKAMIVGVPNVGKSSLINTLAEKKSTKTGNRPGVTKTNQWIRVENKLNLLDTPGVLWPKFESEDLALNLAYIGSIKDEVLPLETIALKLIEKLQKEYPEMLENRYKIEISYNPLETMEDIAKKRGAISRGNEIDYSRTTDIILDEFRKGVIGNISLEKADV